MKSLRHLAIIVAILLGGCGSSPSPVLPPVKLTAVQNTFTITRQWQSDFGDGASDNYLKLSPVMDDHTFYSIDDQGLLTAYDIRSKSLRWEVNLKVPVGSGLTLANDLLLFGSSHGDVMAVHKQDGQVVWHAHVSSEVLAPPRVAGNVVIVRCVNGTLYSLSLKDGKENWSQEQITPALTLRGTSTPVIAGDIVLSAFDNGRLLALNLQSGKLLWQTTIATPHGRTDLERMVDIDASPVVVDDIVYAVTYQGRIAAVQLGSGRILWSRDIGSYIGMAVDPYRIYLADSQSQIWALDRFNGATLWKNDVLLRRSVTTPKLQNQYLIVADFDGFVHWLRRDNGKLVARLRLNDYNYTTPNLNETQDLEFPKLQNILIPPLLRGNMVVAVNRFGHTEAFLVNYP